MTDGDPEAGGGTAGDDAVDDSASRRLTLARRWHPAGFTVLATLGVLVLLVIGATAGIALFARGGGSGATPRAGSVDAGFSQDMIVHHQQGVLMAHLAERQSSDPEIQRYAYDMAYTQTAQIGQMSGWLALWGLPEVTSGPHMAWMVAGGHGHEDAGASPLQGTGLMPGMATNAEVEKLKSLRGKASDIYFMQLMIRHHEGGTPMMDYAARHAANPVVRNFAQQMLTTQGAEVIDMTTMLAARGAAPLAYTPPATPGG